MRILQLVGLVFFLVSGTVALAADGKDLSTPWGGASSLPIDYKPQKVVYNVKVKTVDAMNSVLDRASHISNITGADPFEQSIVLVLHGAEISLFARKNF